MSDDSTTFRATLPDTLSAIKISGSGGVRVQLDIPDTDMAEALRVMLWRDRVLLVTVRPEEAPVNTLMELDDEAEKDAEGGAPIMDRRRSANRRDKRAR